VTASAERLDGKTTTMGAQSLAGLGKRPRSAFRLERIGVMKSCVLFGDAGIECALLDEIEPRDSKPLSHALTRVYDRPQAVAAVRL
jgi:hypothetical protein